MDLLFCLKKIMFETSKTFLHFHSRCCGRKAARNVQQSTHHATDSEMSYRSKTASNHKPVNRSVRKRRHQRHPPSTTMGSNPPFGQKWPLTNTVSTFVARSPFVGTQYHSAFTHPLGVGFVFTSWFGRVFCWLSSFEQVGVLSGQ